VQELSKLAEEPFKSVGVNEGEDPNRVLPHNLAALFIEPSALNWGFDADASTHPGKKPSGFEHPLPLGSELDAVTVPIRDVENENLERLTRLRAECRTEVQLCLIGWHDLMTQKYAYWAHMSTQAVSHYFNYLLL